MAATVPTRTRRSAASVVVPRSRGEYSVLRSNPPAPLPRFRVSGMGFHSDFARDRSPKKGKCPPDRRPRWAIHRPMGIYPLRNTISPVFPVQRRSFPLIFFFSIPPFRSHIHLPPPPPTNICIAARVLPSQSIHPSQPSAIQALQMLRIHRPHPSGLPDVVARGHPRRRTVRALLDQVPLCAAVRRGRAGSTVVVRGLVSHPPPPWVQVDTDRDARHVRGGIVAIRPPPDDVLHISRMDGTTGLDNRSMGMGIDEDGRRGGGGDRDNHRRHLP
jgi:hypothetical protein